MLPSLIITSSQNGPAPASWYGLLEQEPLAAFLINAPDFTPRSLRITCPSNFWFFLVSVFFLLLPHSFILFTHYGEMP